MCSETSVTFYICRLPKYFSFCVSKSLEELWSTSCFRYSISHAKKRRKYWVLFHACLVLDLAWLWGAELRLEPLELWKCSTQSGQMLKFTFRKVFVTADTHCSDGVLLSSFCADELLDGNQTATSLCMSCAAGSHFDPWFFQKVNVQLGCILGCICILLWNRTCNKIIFIDKISQAIKTSCLLQQPCYKNKPCETSSPWYSALSQVLNGSYQTIGRHCSLQVLILTVLSVHRSANGSSFMWEGQKNCSGFSVLGTKQMLFTSYRWPNDLHVTAQHCPHGSFLLGHNCM